MDGQPASDTPSSQPTPATVAPSPAAKPAAAPAHRLGPWLLRLVILAIAVAVLGVLATNWDRWVGTDVRQTTHDAYVRGDITPLSAQVEGYVRKVAVGDFQMVKAGDLLVVTNDDDYQAK